MIYMTKNVFVLWKVIPVQLTETFGTICYSFMQSLTKTSHHDYKWNGTSTHANVETLFGIVWYTSCDNVEFPNPIDEDKHILLF